MGVHILNKTASLLIALVFLLIFIYADYARADMNAANPQAASFANVDKGSSGSGGDLILPIQLFNVPGLGGLDIPVSIIYSSSDNTLRKDSTDVGFGFSLGASSAITRSVNGVPDEYVHVNDRIDSDCNGDTVNIEETGWLFDRPGGTGLKYSERDTPGVNICPSAVDCRPKSSNDCLAIGGCYWDDLDGLCKNSYSSNKLYDYIQGVIRSNPDNFYISVNGEGSGMMFNSNRQFIFGNVKPWKISYSYDASGASGISEFIVTVQDGTKYIFKNLGINTKTTQTICDNDPELIASTDEQTKFLNYACYTRNLAASSTNKPYTYSWPLAYIESADYVDSDSIPGPSQNDKGSWVKFDYETGPTVTIENSPSYLYSGSVFYGNEGEHLFKQAKIASSSEIVDYRLIKITTPLYEADLDYLPRGIHDSVRPGLNKLNFISLKQNPDVPGASQELLKKIVFDYYTDSSRINGKLTLRQIKEYGISESASLPPTKFEYKNIPCSAENKYGLCASDPTDFLISTITYPTGGKAKYVFQPDNVYYLQDVQEINTLRCLQDNIGTVPFWTTCQTNFNPFNGIGTRLSKIEADDGAGETTSTYYSYGQGVIDSDPFCRKIKTTATQYWPSEFIGCKGSVSAGYSYSESDIGRSSVNKVTYTSISTRIIGKSGSSDSGAIADYYITARDYPSVCSGNGNCLTSFDYQYGRPIRTRFGKSDSTLFRETFYSYNLDGKDLGMDDVSYSNWFNSRSDHIYKIPLLDWDHLDEEKGIPRPETARIVPDTFTGKDTYGYLSSGNFLMRQQEVEYPSGSSVPNIISSKAFSYYSAGNDVPDSYYSSSFNPGNIYSYSNFNGMPKKIIEYLLYKNCYAYTLPSLPALSMLGSVSYYTCTPIKAREINYNFAFQNQPGLLLQKNMKNQEGSITLMETSYDSYGTVSSRKPLSYADTLWLAFNNDQVYPAAKKAWLDKNRNQQIDPEDIYSPDNEYVYMNFDQYDTHGNLLKYTDPIGTEYHATYYLNKYPEKIWNAFLGSSSNPIQENTYDKLGNIKTITEINQKTTTYNYDDLGRLTEVIKPSDLLPSQKISYCYALDSNPNCDNSFPNLNYVSATNVLNDLVSVESRSFSDGLGKIKQAAVIESPSSTIRMNNEYYENGKLKKNYKPVRDQGAVSSGTLKFKPYDLLAPQGLQTKQVINTGYTVYDFNTKDKIATDNNNDDYNSGITGFAAGVGGDGDGNGEFILPCKSNCKNDGDSSYRSIFVRTPGVLGAKIYLDSNPVGVTDLYDSNNPTILYGVIDGYHLISASKDSHTRDEKMIETIRGQVIDVDLNLIFLDPTKGHLAILTDPAGALIYLDNEANPEGTSPMILYNLNTGQHNVRATKESYIETSSTITLAATQTYRLSLPLTRIPDPGTTYTYTNDPLLRLKTIENPDGTKVSKDYSSLKEPVTVEVCGTTNGKRCSAEHQPDSTYTMRVTASDYPAATNTCRYDSANGCFKFLTLETKPICTFDSVCTGATSSDGCPGTVLDKRGTNIQCSYVDAGRSYVEYLYGNTYTCYCAFKGDSNEYYYDGIKTTNTADKIFLKEDIYDENNQNKQQPKKTETYSDVFGNMVKLIDQDGKQTSYEYDLIGKAIKITNANGQATANEYDTLGRLTETSNPDFGIISYKYDSNGNRKEKNQNGVITSYQYDGLNRLTKVVYPNSENEVDYYYDQCSYADSGLMNPSNAVGRLCKVSNGDITKEFAYDDRGRIWREYFTIDNKNYFNTYHYDSADNLVSISNSASPSAVSYEYNSLNQVQNIYAGGKIFNVAYNPESTIDSMQYPNGIRTQYTYTLRDFLETFDIQNFKENGITKNLKQQIGYDNSGNIKTLSEIDSNNQPSKSVTFDYDNLYRLAKAKSDMALPNKFYYNDFEYAYDPLGNRQKENKFSYTYLPGQDKNKLQQVKNSPYGTLITDFTYDNNGNVKTKTYNKEYSICNIGYGANVDGTSYVYFAFDNNVPLDAEMSIAYDSNVYDADPDSVSNKHYEWLGRITGQTANENILCNGARSNKILRIDRPNLQSQKSDTDADSNSWYAAQKDLPKFKAYKPGRDTDTFVFDSENRLRAIASSDGGCSNYFYDENGLRVKKIENDQTTIYIYYGSNPIYDESYPAKAICSLNSATSLQINADFTGINSGVSCMGEDTQAFTMTNTGTNRAIVAPTSIIYAYDENKKIYGKGSSLSVYPQYANIDPGQTATFTTMLSGLTGQAAYHKLALSADNANTMSSDYFWCQ